MLPQLYQRALLLFCSLCLLILLSACEKNSADISSNSEQSKQQENLCNFHHGKCTVVKDDITFSITMSPAFAPSEAPISLALESSTEVEIQSISLQGRDMFMGVIPVNFDQTSKTSYLASFIYGSCTSDYMVWRLTVNFLLDSKRQVYFDFRADNPQN